MLDCVDRVGQAEQLAREVGGRAANMVLQAAWVALHDDIIVLDRPG